MVLGNILDYSLKQVKMETKRKPLILVLFFVLLIFLIIFSGEILIAPAPGETPIPTETFSPTETSPLINLTETSFVLRRTGVVKWYDNDIGYGFIAPDRGGEDIAVNADSILSGESSELFPGDRVEYTEFLIYLTGGVNPAQDVVVIEKGNNPNPSSIPTLTSGQIQTIQFLQYQYAKPTIEAAVEEISDGFREVIRSNIAYNKPERMNKGDTAVIELLINPSLSQFALATDVVERRDLATSTAEAGTLIAPPGGEVSIVTENIDVTDRIKATLISLDPGAFVIQEIHDNAVQVISPENTTIWRWSVTAQVEGTKTLELVLYRLIKYDDVDYWQELETYKADIVVEITPIDRIRSWDWKWITGIIVTMLLIPAFWRWFDNKKKQAPEGAQQAVADKGKK